ncbi:response regulator [Flavobacterium sp. NRK1]|uniref:response regulator n=1 Tax=Flavobacterium sp. NRK1 TaxID=2954929 RepID=UPI002092D9FF|nr:response regulator [Flavobacterium sp. NRK1]MCO6149135.1 response regulator [Flavobacterium sp. NRK1]
MKSAFTIFYTDDDPDDQGFFLEIIQTINKDYKVVIQNNGQELLDALDNAPQHPHIVFLDINMPGMNGLEILKIIRDSENHKTLPIIMFSTSRDEKTIARSRELGANFYLPKLELFDHLKKSIEHAITINWQNFKPADNNFVYTLSNK